VAVAAGRKPLYHEMLLEEEATMIADLLRFVIPESVSVACREGHLMAYRLEAVRRILDADPQFYRPNGESDEAAIWRAVNSGDIGELLGYGVRNMSDPNSVLVLIVDGDKVVTGFYAPRDNPFPFAKTRAFDYSFYFQRDLEFLLRQRRTL